MSTLYCLELAYSKNYLHLAKIFLLRLFKMTANQSAPGLNRGWWSNFSCWEISYIPVHWLRGPGFKKWYLMLPCLSLSIIKHGSRVKWSNPRKGVVPSPTPRHSSLWKGSLWVTLDYVSQHIYFICDVYGELYFSQKIYPNGVNMVLLQALFEKTVFSVKTQWLSCKENLPGAMIIKEGYC